jgi:putative ATP-dependent endonuclease of OLD family
MKLKTIRLCGFQSFGAEPTELTLDDITYLIGPNGAGKTAALQALCRMFAFDPSLKRVQRSDFHVPHDEDQAPDERRLWIEIEFIFPELEKVGDFATVAPHFGHMRLVSSTGPACVKFRLEAVLGADGEIDENLVYVLDQMPDGTPLTTSPVQRAERNNIQVHYLPARRDPADHIAYGANALLGRLLRAVDWEKERKEVQGFTEEISKSLASNPSIKSFSDKLKISWGALHKGSYFSDPRVTFIASELESLLRHLSISFAPGHDEDLVDFSRLSDGQKSMLYLSLALSMQSIGRAVLSGEDETFDVNKLKPPIFTIVALEEPENSLSPHYLGRIVNALNTMASNEDAQALIATHAPSMLKRVEPEHIRYLRLSEERTSTIAHIQMPQKTDEAHKFVREAVQAFPEIYFSRLVILGEGDSEEIVLPRILRAKGAPVDESAVTIAPLGGRHVNHFWRLLAGLEIPHLTLLDLDTARYQGGWGRFKYAYDQLMIYHPSAVFPKDHGIPSWKDDKHKVRDYENYIELFEKRGVFFSFPLDLDFAMMMAFPKEYQVELEDPDEDTVKAVLGKSHYDAAQYDENEKQHFASYHSRFKLGSKPAAHIQALAKIDDSELEADMPPELFRLANAVIELLEDLPE